MLLCDDFRGVLSFGSCTDTVRLPIIEAKVRKVSVADCQSLKGSKYGLLQLTRISSFARRVKHCGYHDLHLALVSKSAERELTDKLIQDFNHQETTLCNN